MKEKIYNKRYVIFYSELKGGYMPVRRLATRKQRQIAVQNSVRLFTLLSAIILVIFTGCTGVVVEEDGRPVGSRDSMIMVNPCGNVMNDLDSLVEICYEKVLDPKDSSSYIIGYGKDTYNENDTTALYALASGRYYPQGGAPEGFFINADVGAGHYTYPSFNLV